MVTQGETSSQSVSQVEQYHQDAQVMSHTDWTGQMETDVLVQTELSVASGMASLLSGGWDIRFATEYGSAEIVHVNFKCDHTQSFPPMLIKVLAISISKQKI